MRTRIRKVSRKILPVRLRAKVFDLRHTFRKKYRLKVAEVEVVFSTEDPVSLRWFYPRYENGRLHEPGLTTLLIQDLKRAHTFVDVGAFLGYYTCLASKLMPTGDIISFEMDANNFALLKRNVALNKSQNVSLHNVAIADASGHDVYAKDTGFIGARHYLASQRAGEQHDSAIETEVQSLDSFFACRRFPDVLKVDVEGAEFRVLSGMDGILSAANIKLYVEIHPAKLAHLYDTTPADVVALLESKGLNVFRIKDARATQAPSLEKVDSDTSFEGNTILYAMKGTPSTDWSSSEQ